ncbi:hypothetical protein ACFVSU_10655 [Microbacterium sp. NPDC058062]|uniref:hypothetical protein n=1 Tax=Microbacterium sp. NPDC058062 TaxID=3346320 RepID=UPI0036DD4E7C
MQKRTRLALAAVVSATLAILPAALASADDAVPSPPVEKPVADHLVIDGEEVPVAVMPGFADSGPVVIATDNGLETGVIEEDGTITTDSAAGRPQSRAALAGCGGWTTWVAPANNLWNQSVPGCSLIGTTSTTTAGYSVTVDGSALAGACVQIKGHKLTPVSTGGYQWVTDWKGIGCLPAYGGGGSGTILWGNVADTTRLLTKSSGGGVIGSSGMFAN